MPEASLPVILIVDDEAPLRKALAFEFRRKGYEVLEAGNGRDAYTLVQSQKVDIVLTDVRMPGGDGIELLDNIKARHPVLPVVMFITGFADIAFEDAYGRGADAVIAKPFDRKALLDTVAKAIMDKNKLWGLRSSEFVKMDLEIRLEFPDFKEASLGRVINIGRGGIFVALNGRLPIVESKVAFSIRFQQGRPQKIDGDGIVRWVRARSQDLLPAGCGIEFIYLSDESRIEVIKLIAELRTPAFIPKV